MTANINIKTNSELKKQAESLFADLGMNMTTAFNIFMHQAVRENKLSPLSRHFFSKITN